MSSDFDYFRLLVLKVILQLTSSQSSYSHLVRTFLTLNVDICDIVRNNAFDISLKLKEIIVATKSQLNLEQ